MIVYSRHGRLLEERINARILDLQGQLGQGSATDYPAYRQLCGQLSGLRDALVISEEIDKEISGG